MAEEPQTPPVKLKERMAGILDRLEKEARSRVSKREPIERRWLEDLRQYHGLYEDMVKRDLKRSNRSELFINQTQKNTDAWSARLMDLLFPTDDKNWGIKPTPVPRLAEAAEKAVQIARQKVEEAKRAQMAAQAEGAPPEAMEEAQQAQDAASEAENAASILNARIEEGKRRAGLMEEEIDDQLKESLYHAAMRDVIEDACKIGTGVCKGPVTGDKVRKGWKQQPLLGEDNQPRLDASGNPVMGEYALQTSAPDKTPAMRWVDIWSFFPDMDVKNIQDGEGVFVRHLSNPKAMRSLARLPDFDEGAIRRLLQDGAKSSAPSYLADLRNLNEENSQPTTDLFHVWEYSGPLKGEDLRDLADAVGDETMMEDAGDPDPLDEVYAVVWFCQGELLKLSLYPLDSGECMYSVFNLVKDESTVFGYGVPHLIRDPQRSLNAAWRAMMDNGGRTAGPMFIWSKGVEPEDGDWTLGPWKNLIDSRDVSDGRRAVDVVSIESRQTELANVIALSKQFIEDMAMMPAVAQGEQGDNRQTYGGQALQMSSASVGFRRIVKNFDDDMTTPNIRRMYDWNMQFNQKQEIKGDYEVDARGSSVLLVRELQSQSLMWIAMNLGAHPVFGPMLKNRNVLRKIFQTMMIPADEVVLTDEEIDAILAQAAANDPAASQGSAEAAKMNLQLDVAQIEAAARVQVAELNKETALIGYATKANLSIDELMIKMTDRREERDAKERALLTEVTMAATTGEHAGGAV